MRVWVSDLDGTRPYTSLNVLVLGEQAPSSFELISEGAWSTIHRLLAVFAHNFVSQRFAELWTVTCLDGTTSRTVTSPTMMHHLCHTVSISVCRQIGSLIRSDNLNAV